MTTENKTNDAVQQLRNIVGLARMGAAGLWKYEAALKDAEECIAKFDEENGAPVFWPCGCSWHEKTSVILCEECNQLECFQPPKEIKTPLELFEGGNMNLKSSAGVRKYEFGPYAIRRIENALKPRAALNAPQPVSDLKDAVRDLSDAGKRIRNKSDQDAHVLMNRALEKHAATIKSCKGGNNVAD